MLAGWVGLALSASKRRGYHRRLGCDVRCQPAQCGHAYARRSRRRRRPRRYRSTQMPHNDHLALAAVPYRILSSQRFIFFDVLSAQRSAAVNHGLAPFVHCDR